MSDEHAKKMIAEDSKESSEAQIQTLLGDSETVDVARRPINRDIEKMEGPSERSSLVSCHIAPLKYSPKYSVVAQPRTSLGNSPWIGLKSPMSHAIGEQWLSAALGYGQRCPLWIDGLKID